MHELIFKYLSKCSIQSLSEKEGELIRNAFVPKKIRKRQYFLQEGEVCKYFAFIVKGAMRQYTVDDKGVEHFVHLSIENWWAGDRESFVTLTPSIYNIDAWEDTELLLITRTDFLNLMNLIPVIAEMIRKLDEKDFIAAQRRLNAFISMSAEKRLVDFERIYPEFEQRFPQHIIASYLGVTKVTLSRIRKQTMKKSA
jgi:CRP-like cAMP-binding protein